MTVAVDIHGYAGVDDDDGDPAVKRDVINVARLGALKVVGFLPVCAGAGAGSPRHNVTFVACLGAEVFSPDTDGHLVRLWVEHNEGVTELAVGLEFGESGRCGLGLLSRYIENLLGFIPAVVPVVDENPEADSVGLSCGEGFYGLRLSVVRSVEW